MKIIIYLLVFTTIFNTFAFLLWDNPSARWFYYIIWLLFWYFLWKKTQILKEFLDWIKLNEFMKFFILWLFMIFVEETIAWIAVNILYVDNFIALINSIPQYYANNLLLLSWYIIGWFILLKKYWYSKVEVYVLVWIFWLFAEKIFLHLIKYPIFWITLILPTMFTYIVIIFPSLVSLKQEWTKDISRFLKYSLWIILPIIISIPFLLIHAYLSYLWLIDPSILTK